MLNLLDLKLEVKDVSIFNFESDVKFQLNYF